MERKGFLLRLDPAVHEALAKWAADEFRSLNGQIEWLLREALRESRRLGQKEGGGQGKAGQGNAGEGAS